MKKLLIIASLLLSHLLSLGTTHNIGTILDKTPAKIDKDDILVEYDYDAKGTLILTLNNVSMNAAAKRIKGATILTGDNIIIKPLESYDKRGPVDSYKAYAVQYTIKNVDPDIYTLPHDDTATEGIDRILKIKLDLSKPIKSKTTVSFKVADTGEFPYGKPYDKSSKLDHKAPNFAPVKVWLDQFIGKDKKYLEEYFGKENLKPSTWKPEEKEELVLVTQYKKVDIEFLFIEDKILYHIIDFQ